MSAYDRRVPTPSPDVTLRRLTPSDVPWAHRLSTQAGWNQREEDWRAAIAMTPGASFCAVAGDALVATCIGISYGELSWIAMMLVDPAFQRRRLGERLLLRSIDALPPTRPVGLDATAVGRLLYEQHGFAHSSQLTRWIAEGTELQTTPLEEGAGGTFTVRPVEPSDIAPIAAVDRDIFGGDRRRVLEWAFAVGSHCCAIATIHGEIAGYVFGRPGRVFSHLGTVVARSQSIAQALVRHVASAATAPMGIDAFDSLPAWTDWLQAAGFERQRPLARMIRPPAASPATATTTPVVEHSHPSGLQAFAIFGPEFA